MYLYVCREYVYYLILPLYVFYQKRMTSGTMLSQTRNLYGLRNRQNTVPNLIISSYTINSNDLLYFVSDITVVCVLSDEEDMWHDALSDSQLYGHQIW